MRPLQCDLRCPAPKDNSLTHAAAAPSNLDAAINYNAICKDWVAKHNRTTCTGVRTCSSKTRKSPAPKLRKPADKSLSQPWCSPLQYDLRCPAAKDSSMTHAAAAPSNLDATSTMRSAETELRNTLELQLISRLQKTRLQGILSDLSCFLAQQYDGLVLKTPKVVGLLVPVLGHQNLIYII